MLLLNLNDSAPFIISQKGLNKTLPSKLMATMTIHTHTDTQEVNLRVTAIQANPILTTDVEPFSTKLEENKPKLSTYGSTAVTERVL